jgi:protoheme ferro-lyase
MFSLVLMSNRKQQTSFTIVLALLLLTAVLGAIGSVSMLDDIAGGLANSIVLLILAITLGYALTTFSVLSTSRRKPGTDIGTSILKVEPAERTDVILLAPGEPPEYNTRHAARRLELADDAVDVPPLLLRPFYMRDIKSKYQSIGPSPYRESHIELARKVQSRLDNVNRVTAAFYSDEPELGEKMAALIKEGTRRIVIAHLRVTDPPDAFTTGDLYDGTNPEMFGVSVRRTEPMWDSQLLPQIYVRRMIEALPHTGPDTAEVGILFVGRGHIQSSKAAAARYSEESNFLRRVRDAILRLGFEDRKSAIGWLRHSPTVADSLQSLVAAGCKTIYCIPASFTADGINTLYDIRAQVDPIVKANNIKLISLGGWNADDLAAEEIAAYVRAASPAPAESRRA